MARPAILCKLIPGLHIGVQKNFCATFNWLVDFCSNLRGDGDLDAGKPIKVDLAKDDAPVVRFNPNARAAGGGGGGTEYVAGEDTNIVFSTVQSGVNVGKTAIDVYYI